MQTEDKIRAYRNALARGVDAPCSCAASGHAIECELGRIVLNDVINTLGWVLDDLPVDVAILFQDRLRDVFEMQSN